MSASGGQIRTNKGQMGKDGADRLERPSVSETEAGLRSEQLAYQRSFTFPPSRTEGADQRKEGQSMCPPYGSKSVIGRRAKMEDACVAVPYLLDVPLCQAIDELVPPRIAPQLRSVSTSSRSSDTTTAAAAAALADAQHSGSGVLDSSTHSGRGDASHHSKSGNTGVVTETNLRETVHFFGVFDGHGGAEAALHCARTMHERVREVLTTLTTSSGGNGGANTAAQPGSSPSGAAANFEQQSGAETSSTTTLGDRQASQIDNNNGSNPSNRPSSSCQTDYADAKGDVSSHSSGSSYLDCELEDQQEHHKVEGLQCTTETFEAALTKAFHLTDEEFGALGGYAHLALVGTTAVVALIGNRMMYVANCGDSRAVLLRDGQALALTDDHKAAREDETARVEAAGGQILFWNGVRVMGLLAVSRAIGDHSLRPYVIAQPEVTIVNRSQDDELLVMASDGLWDVMSNQEACTLAKKCLTRAQQRGSSRQSAARVAATVLTRAAVDRGSRDNVTVVIVDLSPETGDNSEENNKDTTANPSTSLNTSEADAGPEKPHVDAGANI